VNQKQRGEIALKLVRHFIYENKTNDDIRILANAGFKKLGEIAKAIGVSLDELDSFILEFEIQKNPEITKRYKK
jgi:hypothetical protein